MNRSLLALSALVAIIVVPFVIRPRRPTPAGTDLAAVERLVIITPHNEPVRHEFARAFRAFMASQGRRVEIDWRSPGGTAEIARYLASEYTASFQHYWTGQLHRPWSAKVAGGFMASSPAPAASSPSPAAGDEAAQAHQAFLASDVGCGLDLLFGGGSVDHVRHARAGRLVDAGVVAAHPELFGPSAI
ncbi:MAG TPA: iron ABC transporter substrate-binding protein, partial [Polyangia bacterium]|nr:iron ABC transporter substrate-binding protein [Polyangia bacterium]